MTAESNPQDSNFMASQWPDRPEGVLIPLEDRIRERQEADKEAQMLQAFYNFTKHNHDIDPRTIASEHSPLLARATHDFLVDVAERRKAAAKQSPHANQEPLYVMPYAPIDDRIKNYYTNFGTRRRTKPEEFRVKEAEFIEEHKRPIFASIRTDEGYDEQGNFIPQQKVPRHASFPELAVGISLERALRKQGHEIAADSVEVVLTAYGTRFLDLTRTAGERGIVRVPATDSHNIRHISQEDIPEDFRAEGYRPQ